MLMRCLPIVIFLMMNPIVHACDTSGFAWPFKPPVAGAGVKVSSPFGMRHHPLLNEMRMHTGVDWAAPVGTPVFALRGGRVSDTGRRGQYGNIVEIDHGASWHTLYAKLSKMNVAPGDCVKAGDVIGEVGTTGLTSGPHLHFELLQYGWPVDPMKPHAP